MLKGSREVGRDAEPQYCPRLCCRRSKEEALQAERAAQEATRQAQREFRAQPVAPAVIHPCAVTAAPADSAITVPEPFQLESERRHAEWQAERERQLREEEARARQEAEFKVSFVGRGPPGACPPDCKTQRLLCGCQLHAQAGGPSLVQCTCRRAQ